MQPYSCDTFVALPPATVGNRVIFGKNSDRLFDEVQEVIYFPAAVHSDLEKRLKVGEIHVVLAIIYCLKYSGTVLLSMYACAPHVCAWCPRTPGQGVGSSGRTVTDSGELSCGC